MNTISTAFNSWTPTHTRSLAAGKTEEVGFFPFQSDSRENLKTLTREECEHIRAEKAAEAANKRFLAAMGLGTLGVLTSVTLLPGAWKIVGIVASTTAAMFMMPGGFLDPDGTGQVI
ncbi:MAG: hypothetical protein HYU64_15625 [Armatimonadetes bacterium]|nr:hypothetical protein [Armatimonadota bacterium]